MLTVMVLQGEKKVNLTNFWKTGERRRIHQHPNRCLGEQLGVCRTLHELDVRNYRNHRIRWAVNNSVKVSGEVSGKCWASEMLYEHRLWLDQPWLHITLTLCFRLLYWVEGQLKNSNRTNNIFGRGAKFAQSFTISLTTESLIKN